MSLRDRSNPTVAYSRPAATFIILHFPCVLFSEGGLGCIASQAVMKYAITIRKNKTGLEFILNRIVVPRTRLELTRANAHHPLKVACLPIPPPGPRFPPQRVFRCANIVTILFFPKYTAKKLPVTKLTRQFDVVFEACGGPGSVRHGCFGKRFIRRSPSLRRGRKRLRCGRLRKARSGCRARCCGRKPDRKRCRSWSRATCGRNSRRSTRPGR